MCQMCEGGSYDADITVGLKILAAQAGAKSSATPAETGKTGREAIPGGTAPRMDSAVGELDSADAQSQRA
jgi:hypothetical protein